MVMFGHQLGEGDEVPAIAYPVRNRSELGLGGAGGLIGRARRLFGLGHIVVGSRSGVERACEVFLIGERRDQLVEQLNLLQLFLSMAARFGRRLNQGLDARSGLVESLQPLGGLARRPGGFVTLGPRVPQTGALELERLQFCICVLHPVLRDVQRGVESLVSEDALEHLVALGRGGLEELLEAVLCQQHRSTEGAEVHAKEPLDAFLDVALLLDGFEGWPLDVVRVQALELVATLAFATKTSLGPPQLTVDLEHQLDVGRVAQLMDE